MTRGRGDSETPRCVRALGKMRSLVRRDLEMRPWGSDAEGGCGLARARQARRGAARGQRHGARARVPTPNNVDYPCLTEYNSKILN
jgi:hypothetical protein